MLAMQCLGLETWCLVNITDKWVVAVVTHSLITDYYYGQELPLLKICPYSPVLFITQFMLCRDPFNTNSNVVSLAITIRKQTIRTRYFHITYNWYQKKRNNL